MHIHKKVVAILLALAVSICCFSVVAFAANDDSQKEEPISQNDRSTVSYMRNLNSVSWTNVYNGDGKDRNVTITSQAPYYCEIRMYEAGSSTPIWQETNSLSPLGTRTYFIGSNITKVEMKTTSSLGAVTVTYYT